MGVRAEVQMIVQFGDVMESILAGTVQGVQQAAEHLLAKSQEQVPMDQGTLGSSGTVAMATEDKGMTAQVVYDTPYAARLHEHPEYHFSKKSNPGAKGKYLEDPAMENKTEIGNIIRAAATKGQISG